MSSLSTGPSLPGSTGTRKPRDRAGKIDGRSVEIQRLIGRSLRAVVDLDRLGTIDFAAPGVLKRDRYFVEWARRSFDQTTIELGRWEFSFVGSATIAAFGTRGNSSDRPASGTISGPWPLSGGRPK